MNLSQLRDRIDLVHGPVLTVISDLLRGCLIAKEGHEFIAADKSAIESRVLNWLAGQEDVLTMYRGHGKIYEYNASGIYRVPMELVTEDQRQIGKVAELALGFQGGKVAFQTMAVNYGVVVGDEQAEAIKIAWRAAHPKVVQFWYDLENAAKAAILNHGKVFAAGAPDRQVKFRVVGSFLWCKLPSGRALCYPYPSLKETEMPWGGMKETIHYMGVSSQTNHWEKQKTYGGSLAENVTQAVARDLLAADMTRAEARGYPVVMHIHDEIVTERKMGEGSPKELEAIMCEAPAWAAGLPSAAKGWRGRRFRK